MKFAHELKEALRREGYPPQWIESAIPYRLLKKSIRKVEAELKSFGLDAVTLRRLDPSSYDPDSQNMRPGSGDTAVAFQYQFSAKDPTLSHPILILYLQLESIVAVSASLPPDTEDHPASLVDKQSRLGRLSSNLNNRFERSFSKEIPSLQLDNSTKRCSSMDRGAPRIKQIEVPLTCDAEFFKILQDDMTALDSLRAKEQKSLSGDIAALGKEVAKATSPSKDRKNDLEAWREIFNFYLQARIFFSTNELDHGTRDSTSALKQLHWFQGEVIKRGILTSFKTSASQQAFNMFTSLNMTLLRNIKFQEINQLAITKILKKFDKHTSLGVKDSFPTVVQSHGIISETLAKAICSQVSKEIVKIVPQLDDYLCPVCFSISYKPVRLKCRHVFCIRCMVRLQKVQDKFCPLCRDEVIMHADSDNIDASLMRFLQRYFPKETKMKQKENEIAAGVDLYGRSYADAKCAMM